MLLLISANFAVSHYTPEEKKVVILPKFREPRKESHPLESYGDLPVCGVDHKTYANASECPCEIASVGPCRPENSYWYQPHGWLLYRPSGTYRSRGNYHTHDPFPFFHP